ncbi:MAG: hypothetical protein ACO3JL_09160, partial [Myxococcota bacterium]
RGLHRAPPLELDRFVRRERRHARDLARCHLTHPPERPRPLPRRRPRHTERGPSYRPAPWPPSPSAEQRELFAP